MKIVLFDLGDTLEHENTLLPGAIETLSSIQNLKDNENQPIILGLVSDFFHANNSDEIKTLQMKYYKIIKDLGIRSFFEPVKERVTLSTEIGVNKPDEKIFRAAIDKISDGLSFHHVIFVTENKEHVVATRSLGMNAIHFKGPEQLEGDIEKLTDSIPIIEKFALSSSESKS